MTAPTRYYVHGDEREPGSYYCTRCDVFFDREHFDNGQCGKPEVYSRSLRGFESTLRMGKPFFRPLDAATLWSARKLDPEAPDYLSPTEQVVTFAMRAWMRRCDAVLEVIGERHRLTPVELAQARILYKKLKEDMKAAAKLGTTDGSRRPRTDAEDRWYFPAVARAVLDLSPATNSHPYNSRWADALCAASSEFSYWLSNLEHPPR